MSRTRRPRRIATVIAVGVGLAVGAGAAGRAQSCDPSYPEICVPPGYPVCEDEPWLVPDCCGEDWANAPWYVEPGSESPIVYHPTDCADAVGW